MNGTLYWRSQTPLITGLFKLIAAVFSVWVSFEALHIGCSNATAYMSRNSVVGLQSTARLDLCNGKIECVLYFVSRHDLYHQS